MMIKFVYMIILNFSFRKKGLPLCINMINDCVDIHYDIFCYDFLNIDITFA